jgi:3-hydroxyisobutyrate dehydrogenase
MGLPMLRRLIGARLDAVGYDVRPLSEFGDSAAHMLESPDGLSQRDILISVVRDRRQTLDLCFDEQAVFAAPPYPRLLVISSTLSPRVITEVRERLPRDVALVDAPMSGAPHAAEAGSLTFMLGGTDRDISRLTPMLAAMGREIRHLGTLGRGMTAKVLNNYVAACSVVAVRRALARGAELDMPADMLLDVMCHSSGATWYGDQFDAISWSREEYASDNTIGILEKDVHSALDALEPGAADAFDVALLDALHALPAAPTRKAANE